MIRKLLKIDFLEWFVTFFLLLKEEKLGSVCGEDFPGFDSNFYSLSKISGNDLNGVGKLHVSSSGQTIGVSV